MATKDQATTSHRESPTVQKGRVTDRNFETLPSCVWDLVGTRGLLLRDLALYLFDRRSWRPWHWDPRAAPGGKQVSDLLRPPGLVPDLFGLTRGSYREYIKRITAATSWAGNPLATYGTNGKAGRACLQHVRLWSIYRPGALLNKHDELQRGNYDAVHHGLFLPFGDIRHGRVVRFFEGTPLLTLDQAGLFLWLLHSANYDALRQGFLEGEGFARVHARVARRCREAHGEIRINLYGPAHELDFQQLERLGWIRPPEEPQAAVDYLVAEAPADLLEFLLLAAVAHQKLPMSRAAELVDEVAEGKHGIFWVLNGLPPYLRLSPAGEELLRVEILHRRLATTSYQSPNPTVEATMDAIQALHLPDHDRRHLEAMVDSLVQTHGEKRVWDVVWNAQRLRKDLDNPVGWIIAALQSGPDAWPLPPAPVQQYAPASDDEFRYLFQSQREEEPALPERISRSGCGKSRNCRK